MKENLFVSMPKSDYDKLMKFKDGLVKLTITGRFGIEHYVFKTPSEVNEDMINKNRELSINLDSLFESTKKIIKENEELKAKNEELTAKLNNKNQPTLLTIFHKLWK